jgi:hypothetical protein
MAIASSRLLGCIAVLTASVLAVTADRANARTPACSGGITGTGASERLAGTPGDDRVAGGGGNDEIVGLAGHDCIAGGVMADVIVAGRGRDEVFANPGADDIAVDDGARDKVTCGRGMDRAVADVIDSLSGCEDVTRVSGPDPAPPRPPPSAACVLEPATLTATGCSTVFEDQGGARDPTSLWGVIDCAHASRHGVVAAGDHHRTPGGASAPNSTARQLTVLDGDDVWGERCELGQNSHKYGPTVFYREGERRITFASFRLPGSFPLTTSQWQAVMQMKQTQPAANGGGTPVLSLKANNGAWSLWQSDSAGPSENSHPLWSAPATQGRWTRFAFDVTYSQNPAIGSIKVYADLNGDGDALDVSERSSGIHTYTLKREIRGGRDTDGIDPGESIPSHLRAGIYHKPTIGCPTPTGCASQIDNVVVVAP